VWQASTFSRFSIARLSPLSALLRPLNQVRLIRTLLGPIETQTVPSKSALTPFFLCLQLSVEEWPGLTDAVTIRLLFAATAGSFAKHQFGDEIS